MRPDLLPERTERQQAETQWRKDQADIPMQTPTDKELAAYIPWQGSYNGDRILVNKYLYSFADPKRWDVVVFKFPGDAKVNYIKRLVVGLPGEKLRIYQGDVYPRQRRLRPQTKTTRSLASRPTKFLPCVSSCTTRITTQPNWTLSVGRSAGTHRRKAVRTPGK